MIEQLRHGRITLALHRLSSGDDSHRPLLLLHGLGEQTPATVPSWAARWAGPVWGLDFTGHGRSSMPRGGGYSAETLLADTDAAIERLGEVSVIGRGVGGYVALLIAGARPALVHGAIIDDGPGLTGGGSQPSGPTFVTPAYPSTATPDPYALVELSRDIRPPDYATRFARFAVDNASVDEPLVISARIRPDWLVAVAAEAGVVSRPFDTAVAHLGR